MNNNKKRASAYLRAPQIRAEYNVPRDRLYRALRSGEMTSMNLGTRRQSYLVRREDVETWLRNLVTVHS